MTGISCRERPAETTQDEPAADMLALAAALRDSARQSAHNVVVLGEQIAGYRIAAAKAPPHRSPVDRWLDAHGQAAQRAVAGMAEIGSPLAAMALWTELVDRWLDANITLLDALFSPPRA